MDNITNYRKEMAIALTIAAATALFVFFSGPKTQDSLALTSTHGAMVAAIAKTVGPEPATQKSRPRLIKAAKVSPEPGPALAVLFPATTELTITVAGQPNLAKLDAYRNPLEENAKQWNCVADRSTGLVWEVKTSDQGLQDASHFYSWYNSDGLENLGDPGQKNNGTCRGGIACDTQSYVRTINTKQLCGYSDWRLPTKNELMSLVQYSPSSTSIGLIDKKYFPNGSVDWYWSSDTDSDNPSHAWYVLYYNGRVMKAPKYQAKKIRLVRGGKEYHSPKNFAGGSELEKNNLAVAADLSSDHY